MDPPLYERRMTVVGTCHPRASKGNRSRHPRASGDPESRLWSLDSPPPGRGRMTVKGGE